MLRHLTVLFLLIFVSLGVNAQDISDHIDYLSSNLGKIQTKKSEFGQSFGMQDGADEACMVWYQKTPFGKGDEERFTFNAADLNENRIQFNTRKDLVILTAAAKGKKDLIRTYENGEVTGYTDEVEMYASSVEDARKLVEELKSLAASCGERMDTNSGLGEDPDKDQVLAYLEENIGEVQINDDRFDQKFTYDRDNSSLITYTLSDIADDKVMVYKLNAMDFNVARIDFDTDKKQVVIDTEIKGKRNLVQVEENGELKNFANKMRFLAPDIESARNLTLVLKDLARISEDEQGNIATLRSDTSPEAALEYLGENVEKVIINEDGYDQSFSQDSDLPYIVNYEFQEEGSEDVQNFQLNLSDMDPSSVDFDVKRNAVFVTAKTSGNDRLIREEKNNALAGFRNNLSIRVSDIESARALQANLYQAVKYYRENRTNNFELSYPDAEIGDAIAYCKGNIKKIAIDDKSFGQTYEVGEEGECLAEIEVENIDKGETTGYLFNWQDINPSKISFSTKGKEVFVSGETKGKKDLIEVAENGEVDDYEKSFKILCSDIESARAMVAAMKLLAKSCGK
ncbi:MAG: hypothetical protein AAFY45_09180 [Bacteroidota bacterium]